MKKVLLPLLWVFIGISIGILLMKLSPDFLSIDFKKDTTCKSNNTEN